MTSTELSSVLAAWFGKPISVLIGGAVGAVVSLRFGQEGLSVKVRLLNMMCSMACANYGAIPIANYFNAQEYRELIAFLVGLFGLSLCTAIFRAVDEADLWALFKSKFDAWGAK